jgi:hypothetical protein
VPCLFVSFRRSLAHVAILAQVVRAQVKENEPHTLGANIIKRTPLYRPPYSRRAAGSTALPNKDLGRQARFSSVSGKLDNPVLDSRLVSGEGYVSHTQWAYYERKER